VWRMIFMGLSAQGSERSQEVYGYEG